jgi:hypothetical protein
MANGHWNGGGLAGAEVGRSPGPRPARSRPIANPSPPSSRPTNPIGRSFGKLCGRLPFHEFAATSGPPVTTSLGEAVLAGGGADRWTRGGAGARATESGWPASVGTGIGWAAATCDWAGATLDAAVGATVAGAATAAVGGATIVVGVGAMASCVATGAAAAVVSGFDEADSLVATVTTDGSAVGSRGAGAFEAGGFGAEALRPGTGAFATGSFGGLIGTAR